MASRCEVPGSEQAFTDGTVSPEVGRDRVAAGQPHPEHPQSRYGIHDGRLVTVRAAEATLLCFRPRRRLHGSRGTATKGSGCRACPPRPPPLRPGFCRHTGHPHTRRGPRSHPSSGPEDLPALVKATLNTVTLRCSFGGREPPINWLLDAGACWRAMSAHVPAPQSGRPGGRWSQKDTPP